MVEPASRLSTARGKAAFAIVAAVLVSRLAFLVGTGQFGVSPPKDYREYVTASTRLAEHGTLASGFILEDRPAPAPSAVLPPIYAGIVAVTYRALGVESYVATALLQILNSLAIATAAWLVMAASELAWGSGTWGRRATWAAGLWVLINPAWLTYVGFVWDTCLLSCGVGAALYFSLRLSRNRHTARSSVLFGLYLGLLALLNPALTPAYPLLVLKAVYRSGRHAWARTAGHVMLVIIAWALILVPWTIRNYQVLGKLVYVRSGLPAELWLGACPQAGIHGDQVFQAQHPLKNDREQELVCRLGEQRYIADLAERTERAIKADPGRWAGLVGMRVLDYYLGTTITHQPGWRPFPPPGRRMAGTFFFIAEFLLVVIFLIRVSRSARWGKEHRRTACWLMGIFILYSAVYCVAHVQIRYRAPSEAVMCVLAGAALAGRPGREETNSDNPPIPASR